MLRCAWVGLGWWGGMHAAAVHGKTDLLRIEACHTDSGDAAVDGAALRTFSEKYGARPFVHFDDLLKDKNVDALVITTPHSRHVPQAIAAANAGKHVLVEKPFALSVESGRKAVEAARNAGVVLGVGHNRRFTSPLRALKSLVDEKALGTIIHAEAQFSYPGGLDFKQGYWRADPAEAPGGAMTATLIHMIDAFMHLLGPIERVIGARSKHRAAPLGIEDTTCMLVEFASGPTGYIGGSVVAPDVTSLNLYGSAANLYAGIDEEYVTIQRKDGPREPHPIAPPTNSLLLELEAFARACAGGSSFPVTPEEALRAIAVMEAGIKAARSGASVAVKPV